MHELIKYIWNRHSDGNTITVGKLMEKLVETIHEYDEDLYDHDEIHSAIQSSLGGK